MHAKNYERTINAIIDINNVLDQSNDPYFAMHLHATTQFNTQDASTKTKHASYLSVLRRINTVSPQSTPPPSIIHVNDTNFPNLPVKHARPLPNLATFKSPPYIPTDTERETPPSPKVVARETPTNSKGSSYLTSFTKEKEIESRLQLLEKMIKKFHAHIQEKEETQSEYTKDSTGMSLATDVSRRQDILEKQVLSLCDKFDKYFSTQNILVTPPAHTSTAIVSHKRHNTDISKSSNEEMSDHSE